MHSKDDLKHQHSIPRFWIHSRHVSDEDRNFNGQHCHRVAIPSHCNTIAFKMSPALSGSFSQSFTNVGVTCFFWVAKKIIKSLKTVKSNG